MEAQITFEVQGMRELQERLSKGDSVMKITLNDGLRKLGRLFVPTKGTGPLANETPKRTGKLARSTFFQIIGGTLDQTLMVMQPAQTPPEYDSKFYGWFVREGTQAHPIRPRYKKALAWGKEIAPGKREFVRRSVQHPGTKPNPYHQRVLDMLTPQIQEIVNEIGQQVTAYLSGGK